VVLRKAEDQVHEEQLSPQLGRLIDAAKAAAASVNPALPVAEGGAVLTGTQPVYAGQAGMDPLSPQASAADAALAAARRAGEGEVLAAAVAIANDPSDTILPSPESRRSLAAVDSDLPIAVKQQGRWVLLSLSQLPASS
jgi:hypothetical protein